MERAVALGLTGLAITDHQGLYGVVRFASAAREAGLNPIVGLEIELEIPTVAPKTDTKSPTEKPCADAVVKTAFGAVGSDVSAMSETAAVGAVNTGDPVAFWSGLEAIVYLNALSLTTVIGNVPLKAFE